MSKLSFQTVSDFLESWGLHYDTPNGESSCIPYPQVYARMCQDASNTDLALREVISVVTNTTDGQTYLRADSYEQLEEIVNNLTKNHI
jgi:hypothetical protein